MSAGFQGSLLEVAGEIGPGSLGSSVRRTALDRGAWIDVRPGWLAGADALFERLSERVPWRGERRQMYDRMVDVPRLLCFYDEDEALPDPALDAAKRALDRHYAAELGSRSGPPGCVSIATAGTASLGTATRSAVGPPTTRWSRSSRSERRGICCCGRAAAGMHCATGSAMAT